MQFSRRVDLDPPLFTSRPDEPLAYSDDVCWHARGSVLWGTNLFMYWGLYNAAKEHGVRALLDGDDGDTTVSHGLHFLAELARTGCWKVLLPERLRGLSKHLNSPPWKILWHRAIKPLAPGHARRVWRVLRRGNRPSWALNNIINSNLAKRIGLEDRIQNLQREWFKPICTEQEDHWRGLSYGLIPEYA